MRQQDPKSSFQDGFTEDERDDALSLAKALDEHVEERDFTALANMSDDEFLRFS